MTTDTRPDVGLDDAPDLTPAELLRRLYALFHNKRTGLALILAMVLLALFGVLFAQAPEGVRDDPAAYASWLEAMRPRYRGWTDILSALGFFRMFSSPAFITVTALLALSILACSAHRTPLLWQAATRPHTHVRESFFDHGRLHRTVTLAAPPEEVFRTVRAALVAQRFRVVEDPNGPGLNLYADRFRFAPFGTVVAHVAFVLILAGVVISSSTGFHDSGFTVTVGERVDVGHGTSLAVELTAFRDEYYEDGRPKDYASDVVLYEDGRQVAAQTVRVNAPLDFGGVSFNQAYFGVAADVTVQDATGATHHIGGVPLQWGTDDGLYTFGILTLPDQALEVYVVAASSGQAERDIQAGEVRFELYAIGEDMPLASGVAAQGVPTTIGDLTLTFERERQFTGLIVSRDPGAPWVWAGAILLMAGTCAAMFFRHRRIWVRVRAADGGSEVRLASPDRVDSTFESRFNELAGALTDVPADRTEKVGHADA